MLKRLVYDSKAVIHVSIIALDAGKVLDYKWMSGKSEIFTIQEDMKLLLKRDDVTMVELRAMETVISEKGIGSISMNGSGNWGINSRYYLLDEELDMLRGKKVVKIRMYTNKGYSDYEIKPKMQDVLAKEITLYDELE